MARLETAAGLLEDPIAIQRSEAELEPLDALGRDAAVLKILPGRLGLGRVQEALVILPLDPGGRFVERSLVDAAGSGRAAGSGGAKLARARAFAA